MEKICRTQTKDLFFGGGDQREIREKNASVSAMTFFFCFVSLEITLKPNKQDEKMFGIFHIDFRMFALFPAFLQEVKT